MVINKIEKLIVYYSIRGLFIFFYRDAMLPKNLCSLALDHFPKEIRKFHMKRICDQLTSKSLCHGSCLIFRNGRWGVSKWFERELIGRCLVAEFDILKRKIIYV